MKINNFKINILKKALKASFYNCDSQWEKHEYNIINNFTDQSNVVEKI